MQLKGGSLGQMTGPQRTNATNLNDEPKTFSDIHPLSLLLLKLCRKGIRKQRLDSYHSSRLQTGNRKKTIVSKVETFTLTTGSMRPRLNHCTSLRASCCTRCRLKFLLKLGLTTKQSRNLQSASASRSFETLLPALSSCKEETSQQCTRSFDKTRCSSVTGTEGYIA